MKQQEEPKEEKTLELIISTKGENLKTLNESWYEKQKEIVEANPFVKIIDNKTYGEAKKRRTALKKARTSVTSQQSVVTKNLNDIKNKAKEVSTELIEITKPHEEKQQAEIDRYEKEIQDAKDEAARLEKERVDEINDNMAHVDKTLQQIVDDMELETIESSKTEFAIQVAEFEKFDYEEFEVAYDEIISFKKEAFGEKEKQLESDKKQSEETELLRLENESNRIINEMTHECGDLVSELQASLEEKKSEFVFHSEKLEALTEVILEKAKQKLQSLIQQNKQNLEFEQLKKEKEQRNSIIQRKESLLDLINQMTLENHECEFQAIQDAMETKVYYLPGLGVFWDAQLELLKATLNEKDQELKQEKERRNGILQERLDALKSLGFEQQEGEIMFFHNKYNNIQFSRSDFENVEFDFKASLDSLQVTIERNEREDQEYQDKINTAIDQIEGLGFAKDTTGGATTWNGHGILIFKSDIEQNVDEIVSELISRVNEIEAEKKRQHNIQGDKEKMQTMIGSLYLNDADFENEECLEFWKSIQSRLAEMKKEISQSVKEF